MLSGVHRKRLSLQVDASQFRANPTSAIQRATTTASHKLIQCLSTPAQNGGEPSDSNAPALTPGRSSTNTSSLSAGRVEEHNSHSQRSSVRSKRKAIVIISSDDDDDDDYNVQRSKKKLALEVFREHRLQSSPDGQGLSWGHFFELMQEPWMQETWIQETGTRNALANSPKADKSSAVLTSSARRRAKSKTKRSARIPSRPRPIKNWTASANAHQERLAKTEKTVPHVSSKSTSDTMINQYTPCSLT
jgi:hypothetical protein